MNSSAGPNLEDSSEVEDEEAGTESVRRLIDRTGGVVEATSSSTNKNEVEIEDNNVITSNLVTAESNGSDENVECCLICMNPYSSQGYHQASCLPCGHVYGLSCIKRWIKHSKQTCSTCPVCKLKCSLENVIKLYSSPLPAVEKGKEKSSLSPLEKLTHEMEEYLRIKIEELEETIHLQVSEQIKMIKDDVRECIERIYEKHEQEIEELTMALEIQEMQIDQLKKRRKPDDPEPHHSSSECNGGINCQLCMSDNHQALNCPFMNTRCIMPNCDGIRMIQRSNTSDNPNRVYLRCQYAECKYFEWMDEACKAATDCCVSSSASPIKYNSDK